VENGVINTWVIEQEPTVIERVMVAAMQKRTSALKGAKALEEVYGFMPVLLLRESDALGQTKVKEIMARNIKTVPCDTTVSQFLDLIAKYHHVAYPMVNEKGEPVGIVTLEEASKVEKSKRQDTLVSCIARRNVVAAYPEETALNAFKRMEEHAVGRILILDPANPKKLLGMITKTDLMHALTNNIENVREPSSA